MASIIHNGTNYRLWSILFASMAILSFVSLTYANSLSPKITISNTVRDIPTPISPAFVEKVANCGKLDLIDRASPKYNPHALVDGSLDGCDN